MWIWRERYEELLRENADRTREAIQHKAEADGATRLAVYVEDELRRVRQDHTLERLRAENAIDELLKTRAFVDPVSPHANERQRFDATAMDNVFEEEDEAAVKRLQDRIEVEGPASSYQEALEETYE